MGRRSDRHSRDTEGTRMSPAALPALHEVLLQAALRAERANEIRNADRRAMELARRLDNRARQQRE